MIKRKITRKVIGVLAMGALVACNSDIGIALMYHEACVKESFA